ncbi:MAG: iron ABC transporter permease [Chromatiales bacterium]|nr:iron ABC transporter permease [Chromatiales bacterium]
MNATADALTPQQARARRRQAGGRGWALVGVLLALITLVPVFVVIGSFFQLDSELWGHLRTHLLPQVAANTLWMSLGVVAGTLLLGTGLGWLVAVCEFPLRRFFSIALLLPMAVPGYVMATAMVGITEFDGPLHQLLRVFLGSDARPWRLSGLGGVVFALTLVLYPYVYLLARNAFLSQGARSLEVGQSLGASRLRSFFTISLPLARPWLAAGALLALMEALADFGTVAVFNYDTFTTAIYRAWYGMFSVQSALQLSGVLILAVIIVVIAEQRLRGSRLYTSLQAGGAHDPRPIVLRGSLRWLATLCAGSVFMLAFLLPAIQLIAWAAPNLARDFDARYIGFARNSLVLAAIAAGLVTALGLLLAYATRLSRPAALGRITARWATLGYAFPGTVLAVGVFVPVAAAGDGINHLLALLFGEQAGRVVLTGTLFTLLLAYCIRFLAVAHSPLASQLQRITQSLDEAARGMGETGLGLLRRVHLPILRRGLLTAGVLVFVDVMKELPVTLMIRPFGWDTLATRVFQMTAEGEWERAALPALAIVAVGLIPVILLLSQTERRNA